MSGPSGLERERVFQQQSQRKKCEEFREKLRKDEDELVAGLEVHKESKAGFMLLCLCLSFIE